MGRISSYRSWRRRPKDAVSEIIGTILTVAITVTLFSGIALFVSTIPQPKGSTTTSFSGQSIFSESVSETYVNITQMGGQALGHTDARVLLTVNGIQVGPFTMQEGGVPGDWVTGQTWSTILDGTSRTDTVQAIIFLTSTGDVIWQATISDLSPSNTPVIISRGIWDTYGVYNSPIYSGTPVHFYARFAAMQAIANLVPDSVKVDARMIGLAPDLQLTRSVSDMYFYESTGDVQAALSWSGKTVTFYFDYYTSDARTDTQRIYVSTTLQVLKNPNGNGNGNGTSGNPPQNINYSALQGFNLFKKSDWDANEYNATPTTIFANDEKAVVVVASQYLVNILGQNDLEVMDSGTGLINYQVSSPANIFSNYAYYAGNYIYTANIDFSKVDPDRFYSVTMGLKDTWSPQHSMYATTQVRVGGEGVALYPVFETFSDPGYTTQSDTFTMNDKIYVQVKTENGYAWDAYGGSVMIKDFFGNKQVNRAPELPQDESGYTYTVSAGKATITGYSGSKTELLIPTTLGGYPVTAIGASAFSAKTAISSVSIPETVISIGASAFSGCTNLDSVVIGANVTTIGASAFSGCADLSLISFLGMSAPTSVGSNWISGTSSTIRGQALATSDFLPNSDKDNKWNGLRIGVLMPIDKNPVSTVSQLTGVRINTYRFVIDLALAGQEPWISGQNHYTLSYDTFKTGSSGSTEQYYLAKVIYVAGPVQTLDIVTSGKSIGDHHRHLADSNNAVQYYLNDDDWQDPYAVATYIASDPHHSWNSPEGSYAAIGDVDGDGKLDIVAIVYDDYERRDSETTLNVYWNDGQWSRSIIAYLPYQAVPTALTLGNADLDGDPDIFVAYSFPVGKHHWNPLAVASVGVYLNDGTWTYEEICNSATPIRYLAVGDLDMNQGENIPDCSNDVVVGFDRSGTGTITGSFVIYKNTNYMGHEWTAVGITFSDGSVPKEARGVLIDNLDSTWKNEFVLLDKWNQVYLGTYDAGAGTATAAKIPCTASSTDPSPANTVGYGLGTGVVIGKRGERLRDIVVTQSSWIKLGGSTYKTTFDITVLNQASLFTFTKSALSDQYFYFSETKHGSKEYRNPTCTVAADVDGNGLTDIVLSGSDGEIRLLYNLRGTTADASWNAIQVDMGSEAMGWTTNSLVTSLSVANLHGGTSIGPIVVPGTPDVTATPSNTKVTLAWEGPAIDGGSPITGYKVYFSADGGHTYTTTLVTPVTMSYTFTDLTNYQKYWFKVSAINAMGEGAAAEVSATPAPTAPAAPTNLAGARGNGQVTLTWIAPSDDGGMPIDYYVVYQNGAALASHPTTTSMLVTGLFNGNTYSFTVAAHNSVGLSEQSGAVSATPATVPGAPTNPLAKRDASTKITVSWAAPTSNGGSAITGYVIYYNWNSATSTFTSSMNVGLVSSYQFTGLTNGKTYYYMVRAVNELGQGADSTIVFATP